MVAVARVYERPKRVPTWREFSARHENAKRIATAVAAKLAEGCRVFDEDGDELQEVQFRGNGDLVYSFREGGNIVLFLANREFDNGAMDTIAEHRAKFAGWTFIHPRDIRPLKI